MTFQPTPYKVSTITATGSINTPISLDSLFNFIELDKGDEGIVQVEFGNKKTDTIQKCYLKRPVEEYENGKKRFDNQVTIIYKKHVEDAKKPMTINTKIFKNGNVQMTGIRVIEQGVQMIDKIIGIIKKIHTENDVNIVENYESLENTNFRIRLINCDFKTGIEIRRDALFSLILRNYNVTVTYEPCIYPGVKIQYWWNDMNYKDDGGCYCKGKCVGKGCGSGEGNCKKITIAVFQSGCVIITGGQSMQQIDDAYDFICKCMTKHLTTIHKKNMLLMSNDTIPPPPK
jgi:TATA-box binding protein (TBP) (component of TFIID and TFIIIB)